MIIKCRNNLWDYRKAYASHVYIPEFYYHEGEIIDSPSWAKEYVCLKTNDPSFPIRMIWKENIVGYKKPKKIKPTTWRVKGSKGNYYQVSNINNSWECTCPGFSFRRTCKHILEKKESI